MLLLSCAFSLQLSAAENLYTFSTLGYSDIELDQTNSENFTYKLGFGYQFHRQWYVEAGYQQLAYDDLYVAEIPNANDVLTEESVKQGHALFLAVLGKASSRQGELFYRLGVLKTDIRGQDLYVGVRECELGNATTFNVENLGPATICDYDNGGIAAVLGLGFDYFVGARTLLRTEIEYIKGQDGLAATAFSVGVRYNF